MQPDPPTHEERLHANYSAAGVAVIQALYSDGYLSIGGTASTDELARLAGITTQSRVLDIGCGVGGPALHLAASIGCTVVGIDLVESSIEQANQQAVQRGLTDLVSFQPGDAISLPFSDTTFDVVISQDAWCHVADKPALLAQVHRVLLEDGVLAFTDWLVGTGGLPSERAVALDDALSTTAVTADDYLTMLDEAGFDVAEYVDVSQTFVRQYQEICTALDANRSKLVDQFGHRVYGIVSEINTKVLRGFEGAMIAGGRFVAKVAG